MCDSRSSQEEYNKKSKRQIPRVVSMRSSRQGRSDDSSCRQGLFLVGAHDERQRRGDSNNGLHADAVSSIRSLI